MTQAIKLGFVSDGLGEKESVAELLTQFYFPYLNDEAMPFPYLSGDTSLKSVVGKKVALLRQGIQLPQDSLFVNRAVAGMYMGLARLGATANWYRISREYVCGDPPSTPLGVAADQWRRGSSAT